MDGSGSVSKKEERGSSPRCHRHHRRKMIFCPPTSSSSHWRPRQSFKPLPIFQTGDELPNRSGADETLFDSSTRKHCAKPSRCVQSATLARGGFMMKRANISPASTSFGLSIVKHGEAYPTANIFIKEVSFERRNRGGGDGEISGVGRGRKPHAKVPPLSLFPLSSSDGRERGKRKETINK